MFEGNSVMNKVKLWNRIIHVLGFHTMDTVKINITTSRLKCRVCKKYFTNSLFGLFEEEK